MNSTYHLSRDELLALGLRSIGTNVLVDRTCRIYGAGRLSIGSNVRIDAGTVLSASSDGMHIGDFVHISAGVIIVGQAAVRIEDFVNLSARVTIFSSNDDYSGAAMAGAMVPDEYRNVHSAPVHLGKHALIGASSIILPGVHVGVGAAVGAMSLVKQSVAEFTIVAGNPLRKIGDRSRALLEHEAHLRGANRVRDAA
jgi:galactoside O-acetyltransferase